MNFAGFVLTGLILVSLAAIILIFSKNVDKVDKPAFKKGERKKKKKGLGSKKIAQLFSRKKADKNALGEIKVDEKVDLESEEDELNFSQEEENSKKEINLFKDGLLAGDDDEEEDFSEAIISVRKKKKKKVLTDVSPSKKKPTDETSSLEVDYQILEKKLLQKIEKNPRDLETFSQLGDLYIKLDKLKDAQEVYKFILSVNPRNLNAKRRMEKIKLLKRIRKR